MADKVSIPVTFDERRGYVGTHPGLQSPVTALSLGGLRRRIEIALQPEVDVDIRLELDRGARLRARPPTAAGAAAAPSCLIPVFAQAFVAAKQLNRCPAAAWSPAPVSTVEIRLLSGPLVACDCSCAMAGDSAAITSEAVTPSTRLREEGRMELSLVGG